MFKNQADRESWMVNREPTIKAVQIAKRFPFKIGGPRDISNSAHPPGPSFNKEGNSKSHFPFGKGATGDISKPAHPPGTSLNKEGNSKSHPPFGKGATGDISKPAHPPGPSFNKEGNSKSHSPLGKGGMGSISKPAHPPGPSFNKEGNSKGHSPFGKGATGDISKPAHPPGPSFNKEGKSKSHSPFGKGGAGDLQRSGRYFLIVSLLFCLLCIAPNAVAQAVDESIPGDAPTAEFILDECDKVRNPQLDYVLTVEIQSHRPGKEPTEGEYEVYIKGREDTLVKTLKPKRESNRLLLMRGRDLWAYLPNVSKPLRISMRDRLMGDVANGDIARTNFAGDYQPTLLRIDKWDDGSAHYVLDLKAVSGDVTYANARLWVEVGTYYPARAEFFALSGKLLKDCRYTDFKEMAGRLRPTRLVMQDPTLDGKYSEMHYTSMEVREIPDKYFTKQYLKKLSD